MGLYRVFSIFLARSWTIFSAGVIEASKAAVFSAGVIEASNLFI